MKWSEKILYALVFALMKLHALLPLGMLYLLSDFLYLVVYKVVKYRVDVVRENMQLVFPHKSDAERRQLEQEFYHHFCDYFVETIKLCHISDDEMRKRIVFENPEELDNEIKKGKSGFLFLGHYGNWEWVTSITLHFDKNIRFGQIYRPLRNKAIDRIFLKIRSRFHSVGIPKEDTFREIVRWQHSGVQSIIGFMADQNPSARNMHYWTPFLGREVPIFNGVERISKKMGGYVAFLNVRKVKRGYYSCRFEMITTTPEAEPENLITETYARKMEATILQNPAYWLWTHRRWKNER